MKKLVLLLAVVFGVSFVSCGNAEQAAEAVDSAVVDSAVVDSAVVDSVADTAAAVVDSAAAVVEEAAK